VSAILPRETLSPAAIDGIAARRISAANRASEEFFHANCERVARLCHAMALRFQAGGRLLVCSEQAQRSDVDHIVVEFVHPVIVGKRALPAIALPMAGDVRQAAKIFDVIAGNDDILMTLHAGCVDDAWQQLVIGAAERGVLAIVLSGDSPEVPSAQVIHLSVPSHDPCIVQETHEMLYHVLWELVHVFFEHRVVQP
jgi:D-sedoheptulose 7-phosphate isomerase